MESTETQRLTVSQHYGFQPEFPERFDWSLVINGRHRELCELLAEEVLSLREAWMKQGFEGIDPLIPGLQEALRLIADKAVWRVVQVKDVRPGFPEEQEPIRRNHTSRPHRPVDLNKRQNEVARKLR